MSSLVFNLSRDSLITGANVIDGQIFWTDDRNEPRGINISKFRDADHSSGTTRFAGVDFINTDITVIKPHPFQALSSPTLTTDATSDTLPFEDVFPRFSYRWRYDDGQFSPYAPFTNPIWVSDTFSPRNNYEETLNNAMRNIITRIVFSNVPRGDRNVVAIDLLYNESTSSAVYVYETREILPANRGSGSESFTIDNRNAFRTLPPNQLTRHFDNVPRFAKAQEITGNRLLYANYVQGYNQGPTELGDNGFQCTPSIVNIPVTGDTITNRFQSRQSVKAGRTYQIGVAYIDQFGRQGAMLTSNSSRISTNWTSPGAVQLACDITSDPPPFALRYRYFISEVQIQYFNITAYGVFNEESGTGSTDVWLMFNSSDRNKIADNTSLSYKGDGATFNAARDRRFVLEIQNEAPDAVRFGLGSNLDDTLVVDARVLNYQIVNTAGNYIDGIPSLGDTTIAYEPAAGTGGGFATGSNFAFVRDALSRNETIYVSFADTSGVRYRVTAITQAIDPANAGDAVVLNISTSLTTIPASATENIMFYRREIDPRDIELLQGRFFVRVARTISGRSLPIGHTNVTGQAGMPDMVNLINQYFEADVPGTESVLELFRESAETFSVATDHGNVNNINWFNSEAFIFNDTGNTNVTGILVEENRALGEFNSNPFGQSVRVNAPDENYGEERRQAGMIYSGLYNSRTGINRLNEFISADGITKEIEPNYGSIQKLYTRDTDVVVFCEDKLFRVLADKDALFNADGTTNLSSTNPVLGQTIPVQGEYGISQNPESFAFYGHNIYFSDAARGAIMQFTPINGQLFEISLRGLNDHFRDRLPTATKILGMHDNHSNKFVVSLIGYDGTNPSISADARIPGEGTTSDNITWGYEFHTEGWPARMSFIPEGGVSLNNRFYTWSAGQLWLHNSATAARNNFYGTQFDSQIQVIFNENPSAVKTYLTLGYEGTSGWTVSQLETNLESSSVIGFVDKEGKFYSSISTLVDNHIITGGSGTDADPFTFGTDGQFRRAGVKGFFNIVRMANNSTTAAELFAINTQTFISSN